MDPDFDRPEVLKEYASRYESNAQDWSFAVGDVDSLNFIAGLWGFISKSKRA
jgi:cytochrome oxidase Cu insertion factor (SCO1/SenC/PrrC family)